MVPYSDALYQRTYEYMDVGRFFLVECLSTYCSFSGMSIHTYVRAHVVELCVCARVCCGSVV